MSKKNNRFEKMEFETSGVLKKPSLIEKMKFKRKLELRNEAQVDTIDKEMKKLSADLDKQLEEKERRRSIIRQHEMAKTIKKVQKDELMELEIQKQYPLERKQKAKNKIWIMSFVLFGAITLLYFGGRSGRNIFIEFIFAGILGLLGLRRSRRWW